MNAVLFIILIIYLWGVRKYDEGEIAVASDILARGLAISLGVLAAVIVVFA